MLTMYWGTIKLPSLVWEALNPHLLVLFSFRPIAQTSSAEIIAYRLCTKHSVTTTFKGYGHITICNDWVCLSIWLPTKMRCHPHPPICESPLVQAMIGLFHYVKELCYLSELSFSCRSRLEIPILLYGQCLLGGTL